MKLLLFVGLAALAAVLGVGMYTTEFTTYLGNNPTTCNNCHVMDAVYEGWFHGGHQEWAACGDCHTPHALIPKYLVKAESGFRHVSAFTFGHIPQAIRAKESSRAVVQENCIRCHTESVSNMLDPGQNGGMAFDRYCFECHRGVAHGERGVSTLPYQHKEKDK
jgi:cytochrome c nitrite reductase small subunit